ncbi:hypothetical protein HDU96_001449, partial [Phlyctochytrium bullatum]
MPSAHHTPNLSINTLADTDTGFFIATHMTDDAGANLQAGTDMPTILQVGKKGLIHPETSSEGLEVVYDDLGYEIDLVKTEGRKKVPFKRSILKNVSGYFRPGRFTAIMGASGAGKTSFLNVIAGNAKVGTVSGSLLVNGTPVTGSQIRKLSGFVFQDDVVLSTMTVREAITMSAQLRLPNTLTQAEKMARVDAVIAEMNLGKCADTPIGDEMIKGVSGGERKRCAIAMELITNPRILFLDEPTSGLDTFTAFSVVHTLRSLSRTSNRTIVATIHQPSSQLFRLFDDLLLLAEGRVMYHGPTSAAVPYFTARGYPCPKRSNPADFFFYYILNNQDGTVMPARVADPQSPGGSAGDVRVEDVTDEENSERVARLLDVWEASAENAV